MRYAPPEIPAGTRVVRTGNALYSSVTGKARTTKLFRYLPRHLRTRITPTHRWLPANTWIPEFIAGIRAQDTSLHARPVVQTGCDCPCGVGCHRECVHRCSPRRGVVHALDYRAPPPLFHCPCISPTHSPQQTPGSRQLPGPPPTRFTRPTIGKPRKPPIFR